MTDNDSLALTEPLLPISEEGNAHETEERYFRFANFQNGSDGDESDDSRESRPSASSYQAFPNPPELVKVAEKTVRRCFVIVFADLAVKSIWSPNLLSIFVSLAWKNHSIYVGIIQAIIGISQIVSSEVAKWSTRHYNNIQHVLIKLASIVGICAIFASVFSMAMVDPRLPRPIVSQEYFLWFILANGLWGFYWGIMETALPMVFCDSVSKLSKEKQQIVQSLNDKLHLGGALGTLGALGLFYCKGNKWTVENCIVVMMSGVVCYGCVVIPLFIVVHDEDLVDGSEDDGSGEESTNLDNDSSDDGSTINDEEWFDPLIAQNDEAFVITADYQRDPLRIEVDEVTDDGEMPTASTNVCSCCADNVLIPLLIHLGDILSSFAGGISAWYLPLFLSRFVGVQPISLQFLYFFLPLGQKLSGSLANDMAKVVGPCMTCILLQWTYVLLLLGMVDCTLRGFEIWQVCTLFFLHGSLMNSTSSLSQTMIGDLVDFEEEHKWEFSGTLQKILWSSSGLLGGWFTARSRFGIKNTFYSTAFLQFLAGIPVIILYCLRDPRLESQKDFDNIDDENGENLSLSHEEGIKKGILIPSTPETESADSEDEYYDAQAPPTTWVV